MKTILFNLFYLRFLPRIKVYTSAFSHSFKGPDSWGDVRHNIFDLDIYTDHDPAMREHYEAGASIGFLIWNIKIYWKRAEK